jgi:phosphonate transport system substrate-binding protein
MRREDVMAPRGGPLPLPGIFGSTKLSRRSVSSGLAAMAVTAYSGSVSVAEVTRPVLIGLTPVLLTSDLELLAVLRSYLERAWRRDVQIVTRRTYQEITLLLISGQIDAAWICGYPYVQYREQLELVAVPIWHGRPLYQSYLIVEADRQAEAFAQLKGDVHAFSDPDSNSGFLVTRALLADLSERPETFFRRHLFTYGHRNVVRAVASGLANSGSVDGYVWEVLRAVEPELTAATRVLRKSEWLGFPPVAAGKTRPSGLSVGDLAAAFVGMASDPEGHRVLELLRLDGFTVSEPSLFDAIAAKMVYVRGVG